MHSASDPFDPVKDAKNIAKHGISLARYDDFDFETAMIEPDDRHGEPRFVAIGWIGEQLHVLCYTYRRGRVRPISLRRANQRELRRYDRKTQTPD